MNNRRSSPTTERKDVILSLAFVTFYLNSAVRFFVPAVMPLIIISLHVSLGYAALLVTAYWAGYTIMQVPSGIITDRLTSSRVNIISFYLMAGVFSLFYFFLGDFNVLMIIQFTLGVLSALVYISDSSLIQTWFTRKQRTTSVGIYQTAFFVGASLGEYITIRTASFSLLVAIISITIALFILGTVNLVFIRDPGHIVKTARTGIRFSMSRGVAYVGLIRFSASFVYLGFLSLFTTYLVTSGKISYAGSANYSWLAAAAGIIGSPLGGILTDRYAKNKLIPSLVPTALISILVIILAFVSTIDVIIVAALFMGFLYGIYASPSMSVATELSRNDVEIGGVIGFLNFAAQLGGSISPVVIGYLAEYSGSYSLSFVMVGVISLASLVPIVVLIAGRKHNDIYLRAGDDSGASTEIIK